MITYIEIYQHSKQGDCFNYNYLKEKIPIKYIWNSGELTYTIPISKSIIKDGWCYHNDNGPSETYWIDVDQIYEEEFNWFDNTAKNKEEYLDPNWRKRIEIGLFL